MPRFDFFTVLKKLINISTYEYIRHPKSQCSPSSLDINSLENVKPGIKPLFFNQKIEQKL